MIHAAQIIAEFQQTVTLAGLTTRDVAPLVGIHTSSMARLMGSRARAQRPVLRAIASVTKFLRYAEKQGILTGSAISVSAEPPETKIARIVQLFEDWLMQD